MPRPNTNHSSKSPADVQEEFLARRIQVGSVFVEPLSLGILLLLEELHHPFSTGKESGTLSIRDLCRTILIFHDSAAAGAAFFKGVAELDALAGGLVRTIAPSEIPAIQAAIIKSFTEGMGTLGDKAKLTPPSPAKK